jgi:hypothetical protein
LFMQFDVDDSFGLPFDDLAALAAYAASIPP